MNEEPQQEFKYLAIKNWNRYQSTDREGPKAWIRDYTDQDHDPELSKLTMLQRAVLQGFRRLRGRFGYNAAVPTVNNCPTADGVHWYCCATAVRAQERHNTTAAIQQLINSGFLIPTNEYLNSLEESREEEKKRRVEEMITPAKPSATATPPLEEECDLPEETGKASEDQAGTSDPEALRLAQDFLSWIGSPPYCKNLVIRWSHQIKSTPSSVGYVRSVLRYATENEFFQTGLKPVIRRKEDPMSYLLDDKYENILISMEVAANKKKQAQKSGKERNIVHVEPKHQQMEI